MSSTGRSRKTDKMSQSLIIAGRDIGKSCRGKYTVEDIDEMLVVVADGTGGGEINPNIYIGGFPRVAISAFPFPQEIF